MRAATAGNGTSPPIVADTATTGCHCSRARAIVSPAATGAMRRRRERPTRSIQTTSFASGAASRRNTSRRPIASRDVRLAYSVPTLATFALALASRSAHSKSAWSSSSS